MFDKLKRLGTDTAIYGISTVVGRLLTFLLTPLYTNVLPPSDLGIVATVYAYIAFLNILYGYGMETAFMRYTASLELGDRKQNFSVPFLSVTATAFVFSFMIWFSGNALTDLVRIPPEHTAIISYAAAILFLDALALIPFAHLRMERKAKHFAALKLFNIVLTVVLNVVFLIHLRRGIEGIFLANCLASAATLLLLVPVIARNLTVRWQRELHRALLRFALPSVPSYLASMMIQVIDRPILEALTDKATVGIYQANYRLGIFMMLIVSTFDFAWRPFFLATASEPDARRIFARVLTYFFLIMVGAFLILSFFINDIVTTPIYHGRSLIASEYWGGLTIVPIVLLAYIFLGISNTIVAGIYIEKQTTKLPIVTFIGAAVNIIANVLLIPPFGIAGAAIATLMSYAVMAIVLYMIAQNIYPVEYEFGAMGKIAGAGFLPYILSMFAEPPVAPWIWKIGLLILFTLLLVVLRVFSPMELRRLRNVVLPRTAHEDPKQS